MDGFNLPFVPGSVAEQWMLARDPDEINMALEEIIDQYRSSSLAARAKIPQSDILSIIQQVLGKLGHNDDNLRLNCLRFLKLLSEDHAIVFVEVSFLIYSKLQGFLQESSRMIRTTALSLAASLSAAIPLYNVADNILALVEAKPTHRAYPFKVATVSLLGLIKQCSSANSGVTESHKRLLRAYTIRFANCAVDEFQPQHTANADHQDTISSEEMKSVTHAAMDLLSVSTIVVSELDRPAGKDGKDFGLAINNPAPALRTLLSSVAALHMAAVELDNGVEREICRRMRSLDFPSLAEETTYAVVKSLVGAIKQSAAKALERSLSVEPLAIGKMRANGTSTAPAAADISDNEATPRATLRKQGSRRAATGNTRKSWSSSNETTPRNWEEPTDTATAVSASAKFSPPKLSTQSKSFNGRTTAAPDNNSTAVANTKAPLSHRSDGDGRYQPSWSANSGSSASSGSAEKPPLTDRHSGRYSGRTDSAELGSRKQDMIEAGSFHGSLQSHSGSVHSVHSYASASESFYYSKERAIELDSSKIHRVPSIYTDTAPAGHSSAPTGEPMGRSLRLLKSPHAHVRQRSDSAAAEGSYQGSSDQHRRGYSADVAQSSEWLPVGEYGGYTPSSGGQAGADLGSETEETGRPSGAVSQVLDSASKARLKRSRLKSANANIKNNEQLRAEGTNGGEDGVSFPSPAMRATTLQLQSPNQKSSTEGRQLASMSDTGLDRHLARSHDEQPVGGRRQHGYFDSNEDLQAMGAFEVGAVTPATPESSAPTPLRKPSRRSKLSAQSPVEPAPLNLTEVTSLITKPDTTYDYIASEDLKPLTSPTQEFNKAYKGLEVQEWPEIFHTLNTLRRVALHHSAVMINAGVLHNLVVLTMKRVDELRSSLAKNAILLVEDLLKGLGRSIDMEVATFLPGILKRSTDSSTFLVESADNVLQAMIDNLSCGRTLFGLMQHVTHRNPAVRSKIAVCLHALAHSKGGELNSCKDYEGFKAALPKLLQDSAPEARAYCRELVRMLIHRGIASRAELEEHISADQIDKILHDSTAQALSVTVCSKSLAAPGSADYSGSSPMRSAGRRTGRNVTSARSSGNGMPFSPAMNRSVDTHASEWNHDYGCASTDAMSPPRERDRGQRPSQARQQFTPNKNSSAGKGPADLLTDVEDHSVSKLRASSEQLGAQLDSHLASPLPSPKHARLPRSEQKANSTITTTASSSGYSHTASSGASSGAAGAAVSAAAKRAIEQDPELSRLQDILAATTVSSWADRKTAIDTVTDLLIRHYDVLRDANKLGACVDCLLNRLEDGSVKVHMHAVECLERINSEEPLVLQHNLLQIVVPAVLGSAASTNKLIAGKSIQLLRLLFDTLNPLQVAQYLCQTALHDKEKLRHTALRFLADVMPVFCADADSVLGISKKIIFPMLVKLLFTSSTKADIRVCAVECVRSLQASLRAEKVWLWAEEPAQQEELKRITSTA